MGRCMRWDDGAPCARRSGGLRGGRPRTEFHPCGGGIAALHLRIEPPDKDPGGAAGRAAAAAQQPQCGGDRGGRTAIAEPAAGTGGNRRGAGTIGPRARPGFRHGAADGDAALLRDGGAPGAAGVLRGVSAGERRSADRLRVSRHHRRPAGCGHSHRREAGAGHGCGGGGAEAADGRRGLARLPRRAPPRRARQPS